MIHNVPRGALISQPKVEFPEMAHGVLLVLPPDPLASCAKAALKPILGHLQKTIVCQTRLEASLEVHTLDLGELETTKESSEGNSAIENSENPLAGKFRTTTQPAQCFQHDRVRLVLGRWLLSGLIIDFLGRLPPFMGNTRLVAYHSAMLRLAVLDLICRRRKRNRGRLGISVGNQRVLEGTRLNICGPGGALVEANQKSPQSTSKSEEDRPIYD